METLVPLLLQVAMMISPKSSMASSRFFGFKCCLASLKHEREILDCVCVCDECD
jgi:hypothetical protein